MPKDADLALWGIGPGHGYLDNATTGGPGQEEQLDVEAEASNGERLEQATGGRRRERLEAVLRVGDAFEAHPCDEPVEHAAGHDPMAARRHRDPGIDQGTRAYHDVSARHHRRLEPFQLLDRRGT